MSVTEEYLRPKQVAELLGLGEPTLRNYRSWRKGPPFIKVGNRVLYRSDDLARWIAGEAEKAQNKKARQEAGP